MGGKRGSSETYELVSKRVELNQVTELRSLLVGIGPNGDVWNLFSVSIVNQEFENLRVFILQVDLRATW